MSLLARASNDLWRTNTDSARRWSTICQSSRWGSTTSMIQRTNRLPRRPPGGVAEAGFYLRWHRIRKWTVFRRALEAASLLRLDIAVLDDLAPAFFLSIDEGCRFRWGT